MTDQRALVWFPVDGVPPKGEIVMLWQQEAIDPENPREVSIPDRVREEAAKWKGRYGNWIGNLGARTGSKLVLERDLNYWLMTLPTEPCFSDDALPYKVVRLWALAEVMRDMPVTELVLVEPPRDIENAIREWARSTGVSVTTTNRILEPRQRGRRISATLMFSTLISIAQGFGYLLRDLSRYRGGARGGVKHDSTELVIVDYFDNFRIDSGLSPSFVSNYWGELPKLLADLGVKVRWVHIDYRSASAPTIRDARIAIQRLNDGSSSQHHQLLDDSFSPRTFWRSLKIYASILKVGYRSDSRCVDWSDPAGGPDPGALVQSNWTSSLFGLGAARNARWLALFDALAAATAKSTPCLHLMEGQAWEHALCHAWKSEGGREVCGVIHSTVRYWDFRFVPHSGKGEFRSRSDSPDLILVNGPIPHKTLIGNGYSELTCVPVEALRFNTLVRRRSIGETETRPMGYRLLLLGEYDPPMARRQLRMFNSLARSVMNSAELRFRPHPSMYGMPEDLDPRIEVSTSHNILEDLTWCSSAICSSVSSSLLDAQLTNVHTVVIPDPRYFDGRISEAPNLGDQEILSPDEIGKRLMSHRMCTNAASNTNHILYLDSELPRWRIALAKLLAGSTKACNPEDGNSC